MLAIFWLRPGRAAEGVTSLGSPPSPKMLAIILRSVDDDTKLRVEEADAAAEVVRGTKAKVAVEEAAARTPSKTGREEKIF